MTYRLIDHTADFGIRVFGPDAGSLYEAAGRAMFDQICDPARLTGPDTRNLSVAGADWPDLMVNWLRELLFLWTGDEKVVTVIDIRQISETTVSARVAAERYAPNRHHILHEIKAVTYHQIDVTPVQDGWQAVVVFDI